MKKELENLNRVLKAVFHESAAVETEGGLLVDNWFAVVKEEDKYIVLLGSDGLHMYEHHAFYHIIMWLVKQIAESRAKVECDFILLEIERANRRDIEEIK